jgi:hypothetical protein
MINQVSSMFDAIKNLLKPKEKKTLFTISFNDIPAWLDKRENAARVRLRQDTIPSMQAIRNGMAQLQHIVNSIAGAEHDEALHPKLKSIAKNSLPQFTKAMHTSLAKEMPEDVEEFYAAAAECVKGCLNSSRGQGRYLLTVFPEEMKSVKSGIDALGHEINAMNIPLGAYRKEVTLIHEIRARHTDLANLEEDTRKSVDKDNRIDARIAEFSGRLESIAKELESLNSPEHMQDVTAKRDALAGIEKKRDEMARTYATMTMTASHVMRKAEKIAAKQHQQQEIAIIKNTIGLLSDHTVPPGEELVAALTSACPIAHRMIETGEIPLKNKEERAVFSDIPEFCTAIGTACADLKRYEQECEKGEQELAAHPLIQRISSLNREKTQLEVMLGKEKQAKEDLVLWREKAQEKIPALKGEITQKIEQMIGEAVQLQADNLSPA